MSKKHKTKVEEEPPIEEHSETLPDSHAAGIVEAIEKNRVLVLSSAGVLMGGLGFFWINSVIRAQLQKELVA